MGLGTLQYQDGGVFLPSLGLWLDPHGARRGPERVFVSHAHSDHIAAHREVILTAPTRRLMQTRLAGRRIEHVLDLHRPAEFETAGRRWRITLLPAGHILGSAMALLDCEGESLLFTGDFKLRAGRSAEPCTPVPADLLVMETTFGRPHYVFPPGEEVLAAVVQFCRDAMAGGATPVLLGYSLGKSQELLAGLTNAGLPLLVHEQIVRLNRVYEEFGQMFPPYAPFAGQAPAGQVVLAPPMAAWVDSLREAQPVRTALLTGWAIDPAFRFRSRCDAVFPLSDHADFPELVELVHRVRPRRVYTLHGFAAEFAWTLRDLGYDARALGGDEQLTLPLGLVPSQPPARRQ